MGINVTILADEARRATDEKIAARKRERAPKVQKLIDYAMENIAEAINSDDDEVTNFAYVGVLHQHPDVVTDAVEILTGSGYTVKTASWHDYVLKVSW